MFYNYTITKKAAMLFLLITNLLSYSQVETRNKKRIKYILRNTYIGVIIWKRNQAFNKTTQCTRSDMSILKYHILQTIKCFLI